MGVGLARARQPLLNRRRRRRRRLHRPAPTCLQGSFGSSDGSDWDSYWDGEEKERCFLVGVQVRAGGPGTRTARLAGCCWRCCVAPVQSLLGLCCPQCRYPPTHPPRRRAIVSRALQLKQQRGRHGYGVHESLEELGRLADTAGLEVTGSTYQLLDDVSPHAYACSACCPACGVCALEVAGSTCQLPTT